eukprot:2930025-Alexandrium_andersonii.AAC.1
MHTAPIAEPAPLSAQRLQAHISPRGGSARRSHAMCRGNAREAPQGPTVMVQCQHDVLYMDMFGMSYMVMHRAVGTRTRLFPVF